MQENGIRKKTTVGFVSVTDPFRDKKAWSGTIFRLCRSIVEAGFDVRWVRVNVPNFKYRFRKLCNKIRFGQYSKFIQSASYWKLCAESVVKSDLDGCDCLFFPSNAQMTRYADFGLPVINFSDATFAIMLDYYWFRQKNGMRSQGNACEEYALRHSDVIIRASDWAAESVIRDYGGDASRVHVLEFGANLDDRDIRESAPWTGGPLNILFSGVDWSRKGGAVAVDTVRLLRERGYDARLVVVGPRQIPEECDGLDYVDYLGFLDKGSQDDYWKYVDAVSGSHLFILPSKAECAGIVFCEASAYGLPSFAYDTGGVGNYVIDGVNGYRLPLSSGHEGFAATIERCILSGELPSLHQGCLRIYSEKLNWNVWGEKFREILASHCIV